MHNKDIDQALEFHQRTKHSPESVRGSRHFLDWANQPLPFKIYRDLEARPLPAEIPSTGTPALTAIASAGAASSGEPPRLAQLAHLLYHSAGITRRRPYPGGEILFRAAACTGALYQIELYLACGPLPDLPAGLYHFGPRDFALRRLREGDYRGLAAGAAGGDPSLDRAAAIVFSTGTYWRNAWKYQARAYRHFGWDSGTLHANLLAAAESWGWRPRLVCGFADDQINRLLDVDPGQEVALAMVALGSGPPALADSAAPPPLGFSTEPLSRHQVDYPAMHEVHAASSLHTTEEAAAWRQEPIETRPLPPPAEDLVPPAPLGDDQIPGDTIEAVIQRRGSSRGFHRRPIRLDQLSTLLDRSTRGIPADFSPSAGTLNDLYLIVHAVEGLDPGAYVYRTAERSLERLKRGDFRRQAAYLALDQDLAGDAAVAVFFLTDLERWLGRFGNRGYRAVQLEAGILGGKMYLAAYSQRLGATGLTFYDDEVVRFFSPHAAGKSAIFLVAIGHGRSNR